MTERRPRRSRLPDAPETPRGYRQTRRGSSALKSSRRAKKRHELEVAVARLLRSARNILLLVVQGVGIVVAVLIVLLLIANGVNTFARWNAKRLADREASPDERARRTKENVLFVGVEGDKAVGYLALRVDRRSGQVFGVAVPDGAFVDIPGRGFERIGEAWKGGPETALATVSNFLTVPFENYVAVPAQAYRDALTAQSVSSLPDSAVSTSLGAAELSALDGELDKIPRDNVAIVPMPVKPIKLGDQTYFEPQRGEIADLLESWWGVDSESAEETVRVIVYNGAGVPGIAGEAAQVLIRSGFRVIDTKNADRFDYRATRIVVRRGDARRGDSVREALGVGSVAVETSTADVTDVIVIIGKDYKPPR